MARKTWFNINFNRYINFGTLITDASGVHVNPLHQDSITVTFQGGEGGGICREPLSALFEKADIVILYVAG